MKKHIAITDSELPIMKVLWARGASTSPEILDAVEGNKSTVKTLLLRLVKKGAVRTEERSARAYLYFPKVTQEEYIAGTRRNFLQTAFDGSAEKLLLNFVREENVTKEDLQKHIEMLEETEK
jgi:BlaI family penicillinase repressor